MAVPDARHAARIAVAMKLLCSGRRGLLPAEAHC
jgi:hypothetical protein